MNLFGNWLHGTDKKDKVQIQVGILLLFWSIWNVGNDFAFKKARASSFRRLFLWPHIESICGRISKQRNTWIRVLRHTFYNFFCNDRNGCIHQNKLMRVCFWNATALLYDFFRRTRVNDTNDDLQKYCKRYSIHVENLEKYTMVFFLNVLWKFDEHSWYRIQLLERWLIFVFGESGVSAKKNFGFWRIVIWAFPPIRAGWHLALLAF
jgi:hypothetical protein